MTDTLTHHAPIAPTKDGRKRRGGLFVNDTELIERLGWPVKEARRILHELDEDRTSGFPQKQRQWCDKRYWPAVEAYFEATCGLKMEPSKRGRKP